jgi:stearoyl-CoA desaturase (delta-9 desaturase)
MVILIFFICHWYLSLFCQSFFLHRYGAHKQFTMSPRWERFFFVLTWFTQGVSFLNPRAYAIMHRMHHTYSDKLKDPHSPHNAKGITHLMIRTWRLYSDLLRKHFIPKAAFTKSIPEWVSFETFAESWVSRLFWVVFYVVFYILLAPSLWWFLLLPAHIFISPIQGAIVNWSGHKYGYSNYDNHDKSKNTFPFDFLMIGELFQNNHHKHPHRPNFATKWFEFDPTYPVIKVLALFRVIKMA